MSEPLSTRSSRALSSVDPLPRCCAQHPDWPTLSQHLVADFAELSVTDVIREVRHAKEAVATAGMTASDGLLTGELIARHQLMLLAGRIDDMARLDPETHNRAAQMPSQSPPIDES